jgi:hypothetical protein
MMERNEVVYWYNPKVMEEILCLHLKICSLVDIKWSYSTSTEGAGARNSEHDFMEDLFESFYGGSRRDQQQSEERYYNRQADRTT